MLSVSELSCQRGGVRLLEGVSFTLSAGQAIVLRGVNGSGKTTLLRTIAGIQPALTGRIEHPVDAIAYGAHLDGVKSQLSVAENLGFWADVFGQPDISPALESFNLSALENRLGQTLSAGQKRRLGLARLVVSARPIWILDEPTVSLDSESVALFTQVVAKHCQGGGCAVIATHIDLGIQAETIDVSRFKPDKAAISDDPFLAEMAL